MSVKDWLVPDEMQSALKSASQMVESASATSHFWVKHLVASALPFAFGCLVGLYICAQVPDAHKMSGLKDLITGVLTFVAVLAGFMVTLMLFTGRTDGSRSLTVDQAPQYVAKLTYLLFSQALTLAFHLAAIVACLAWLVAIGTDAAPGVARLSLVLSFGFLAISLLRSVVLPFQIYEVHHFELQAMLQEKRNAYQARLDEERRNSRDGKPL